MIIKKLMIYLSDNDMNDNNKISDDETIEKSN